MGLRSALVAICLTLAGSLWTSRAAACPFCRADAAGLSAPAAEATEEPAIQFSGGIDMPTAFYFRGYLQANHGPILQPYLNVFTKRAFSEDTVVRPYVSLFHSASPDDANRMESMSDVMLGAVVSGPALSIDGRYAYYTMNQLMRSNVHEFGVKASYDVLAGCQSCEVLAPLALRPFVGIYADLFDEEGTEDVFVNVGLDSTWRCELAGWKIGLGLPIDWGLSADDYYLNRDGSNAALGYFSTAATASVLLPIQGHGQWFVNASVQYLHLAADSVRDISPDDDLCIGKIGISFVR
jgi:hypothetical protein